MPAYIFFVKKDALAKAGKENLSGGPCAVTMELNKLPKGSYSVFLPSETDTPKYRRFADNPEYKEIVAVGN